MYRGVGNRGGGRGRGGRPNYRRPPCFGDFMNSNNRESSNQETTRGGGGGGGGDRTADENDRKNDGNVEGGTNPDKSNGENALNPTKLRMLLNKDPNEVLLRLLCPFVGFIRRLEQGSADDIMTELILKAVAMVCKSIHASSLLGLLEKVNNSKLLKFDLLIYLQKYISQQKQFNPDTFNDIINILRALVRSFPRKSLVTVSMLSSQIGFILRSISDRQLFENYVLLEEEMTSSRKQIQFGILQRDQEKVESITVDAADDFRRMSVIPTCEDIKGDGDPFLRKNKIYHKYKNAIDYLDVQFRLLKEDLVRPLREGLSELLRSREEGDGRKLRNVMKVYTKVRIISMRCSQNGVIYKVKFDISRLRGIRWSTGKRLTPGSLVCLSADQFQTMLIATVADRDIKDLCKGVIYLCFDNDSGENMRILFNYEYEMIESPAYYEPYKHVLKALQYMDEKPLPFESHLLNQGREEGQEAPKYLRNGIVRYTFSPLRVNSQYEDVSVPVFNLRAWPTAKELNLDDSQYNALRTAITNKFAVIQGPPGTGKTFIGVKIVQLLLTNKIKRQQCLWNRPIMIVCYTNHALDQFLEEIIKLDPDGVKLGKFVRIGSRSKSENEELKKCMLMNIKQNKEIKKFNFSAAAKEPKVRMKVFQNEILKLTAYIELAEEEIINPMELSRFMNYARFQAIGIHIFLRWLNDLDVNIGEPNIFLYNVDVEDQTNVVKELEEQQELDELQSDEREIQPNNFKSEDESKYQKMKQELAQESKIFFTRKETESKSDLFRSWLVVRSIHQKFHEILPESEYLKLADIWELNIADRWRLYNYWTSRFIAEKTEEMNKLIKEHAIEKAKLDEIRNEEDYKLFCNAEIIAMTTTGSAKFRDVLQRVKPRIVIVEEAAEVLEAHIVASLSDECEHLILIGDHQQLRPKTADYDLEKNYSLAISLFEKIVLNNTLQCDRLTIQHRMRPEIAELLVPHIYKSLENHESVFSYENVGGVLGNLFFISHSELEDGADDNKSHSNQHETSFMAAFCNYLLDVGYKPSQITILTTYTGQFFLLRKLLPMTCVRITPVDNFQGEENDIILLSLVRSNLNKIGFLNISNRVCVALSRARKGLFIIGNGELLREVSPLWKNILNALEKEKKLVDSIPLGCRKHLDNIVHVRIADDFKKVPKHGCPHPCEYRLLCGHVCANKCHPFDQEHIEYKCKKPCPKKCPNDHPCLKQCYEYCGNTENLVVSYENLLKVELVKKKLLVPCNKVGVTNYCCDKEYDEYCGDCMENVTRTLSRCQHEAIMPCYMNENNYKCMIPMKRTLSRCQHKAKIPCYVKKHDYKCREPCKKYCPEGHLCQKLCHEYCGHCRKLDLRRWPPTFRSTVISGSERCKKVTSEGQCCEKNYNEYCGDCLEPVNRILSLCQHEATMPCYTKECDYECQQPCTRICPKGHPCKKLCYEYCGGSVGVIKKTTNLVGCKDKLTTSCEKRDSYRNPCGENSHEFCGNCLESVKRMLSRCKHEVKMPCYMEEEEFFRKEKCKVEVERTLSRCGHTAKLPCYLPEESYKCLEPCRKSCDVGHQCKKKCHEVCGKCDIVVEKSLNICQHMVKLPCYQPIGTHKCQSACSNKCPSGHPCKKQCGDGCGNCMVKIWKTLPKCKHNILSECYKAEEDIICEQPCSKFLKCGHKCQQLCGTVQCTDQCKVLVERALPCHHVAKLMCFEDPTNHLCCVKVDVITCKKGHIEKVECHKKHKEIVQCNKLIDLECSTQLPNHVLMVPCHELKDTQYNGCSNVCNAILDCGHHCSAICKNCVFNGRHATCRKTCNKRHPLCSHDCKDTCSTKCRGCSVRRLFKCPHNTSYDACSKPYEPCSKPCEWICPHLCCKQVCSQPCDRLPCNCPCPKQLVCGHICAGLCGEPCPEMCRICHKEKFKSIEKRIRFTRETRFLELIPCHHIVEVKNMDNWIRKNGNVLLPCELDISRSLFLKCPVCRIKIEYCPRYNSLLNTEKMRLNAAKARISESTKLKNTIEQYLQLWLSSNEYNINLKDTLLKADKPRTEERLRLGSICILHEIDNNLSSPNRDDHLLKRYRAVMEHIGQRMTRVDPCTEGIVGDVMRLFALYMEVHVDRIERLIRGPDRRILDRCKELLEPFSKSDAHSVEVVDLERSWKIIEKVNHKLSRKLEPTKRKDKIEDYIEHIIHFYDLELNADFSSFWMCCKQGHVYSTDEHLAVDQIDSCCLSCHPLETFILGRLLPKENDTITNEKKLTVPESNLEKKIGLQTFTNSSYDGPLPLDKYDTRTHAISNPRGARNQTSKSDRTWKQSEMFTQEVQGPRYSFPRVNEQRQTENDGKYTGAFSSGSQTERYQAKEQRGRNSAPQRLDRFRDNSHSYRRSSENCEDIRNSNTNLAHGADEISPQNDMFKSHQNQSNEYKSFRGRANGRSKFENGRRARKVFSAHSRQEQSDYPQDGSKQTLPQDRSFQTTPEGTSRWSHLDSAEQFYETRHHPTRGVTPGRRSRGSRRPNRRP